MQNFITSAENLYTWATPATVILVLVALVGCGIGMMCGQESREKAKKALPYILGGCILILLALVISKEIVSNVAL